MPLLAITRSIFDGGQLYEFNYDFKIRVPRDISLELKTVNHSHITVEGTSGDFKISNVNGGIEMQEVEGSGSVHTVNGPVKVTFARNPTGRDVVQIGERDAGCYVPRRA